MLWGGVSAYRRSQRATEGLATTVCPLWGSPRITISTSVAAVYTQPVRIHEAIHAQQCVELGAIRYAFRNFSSSGRLGLEAPAYCAAAAARIASGQDSLRVRSRLRDDAVEAMAGIADSSSVLGEL